MRNKSGASAPCMLLWRQQIAVTLRNQIWTK